jgi:hypothetical protein
MGKTAVRGKPRMRMTMLIIKKSKKEINIAATLTYACYHYNRTGRFVKG